MNCLFGTYRATSRDSIFMIFLLHWLLCSSVVTWSDQVEDLKFAHPSIKVKFVQGISFSFSSCDLQIVQIIFLSPPEFAQPTFRSRINVVATLPINVEIKLIQRWKWNKIRRRIFHTAQCWYNVSAWRWKNLETTLHNGIDVC